MVKKNYPDYELATNHISHYRDIELVMFSVDRVTHSLIVTFPVFIKDFKQPPLSLFEIETVPVPIPIKIGKQIVTPRSEFTRIISLQVWTTISN